MRRPAGDVLTQATDRMDSSHGGALLRCEHVTRRFGGVTAINDVSFEISEFGVVGIMGPNGSGKSTLLGILSGVVAPTSGRVFLRSADLTGRRAHSFTRAGIARSFQQPRLIPSLRIWEQLALGLEGRCSRERFRRTQEETIDVLVLGPILDRWPNEISIVQQRQVDFARALASSPSVLLLDEPGAGLSHAELEEVETIIANVGKRAAVIVVEHNLDLLYGVALEVIFLMNGVLVLQGTPDEMAVSSVVRSAYLGIQDAEELGSAHPLRM